MHLWGMTQWLLLASVTSNILCSAKQVQCNLQRHYNLSVLRILFKLTNNASPISSPIVTTEVISSAFQEAFCSLSSSDPEHVDFYNILKRPMKDDQERHVQICYLTSHICKMFKRIHTSNGKFLRSLNRKAAKTKNFKERITFEKWE